MASSILIVEFEVKLYDFHTAKILIFLDITKYKVLIINIYNVK